MIAECCVVFGSSDQVKKKKSAQMNPEKKDTVFHVAPPHMAPVDFSEDGLSLCPTTQAQCGLRGGPVRAVGSERGSADVFAASHAVSNRDTEA